MFTQIRQSDFVDSGLSYQGSGEVIVCWCLNELNSANSSRIYKGTFISQGRIDYKFLLSRPEKGTTISLFTTAKRISNVHMAMFWENRFYKLKLAILKRFCKIFIMK